MHDLATGRHWLGVQFITRLNSNTCTALTTKNTTESNCILSRVKKRAHLVNGIHQELVT